MESAIPGERLFKGSISLVSLLAGLALVPLLPLGFQFGITHQWFQYAFLTHGALLLAAVALSLMFLLFLLHKFIWGPLLGALLIAVPLAVIFTQGLLPITSRDALIHHLAVAKWWVQAGMISKIGWHDWSFYPMLINLGFTGLLAHGLDALTPLYHALYLLLIAGCLSSFIYYRNQDADVAYFTYFLTLSLPLCIKLASAPLVDLGLALFCAIAFIALVRWSEEAQKFRFVIMCGVSLGLALSCKYNGILACAMLLLVTPIIAARARVTFGKTFFAMLFIGVLALIIFSPWLIRNTLWTSNPVYPLFRSTFGAEQSPFAIRALKPLIHRMEIYKETSLEIALIPFRMLIEGEDDNPRLFDGVLTPLLFLALFPLFKPRKDPWVAGSYYFCIAYFLVAIVVSPARVRYLAPILGPTILLSAYGFYHCGYFLGIRRKNIIYSTLIILQLGFSLAYSLVLVNKSGSISYLRGEVTGDEFLAKRFDEYPMIQYVNSSLEDTASLYLLCTGNRFYLFKRQTTSAGYFCSSEIRRWVKTSANAKQIAIAFEQRGLTHLLAHRERSVEAISENLSAEEAAVWNEFQRNYLSQVHTSGNYTLWKIEHDPHVAEQQS